MRGEPCISHRGIIRECFPRHRRSLPLPAPHPHRCSLLVFSFSRSLTLSPFSRFYYFLFRPTTRGRARIYDCNGFSVRATINLLRHANEFSLPIAADRRDAIACGNAGCIKRGSNSLRTPLAPVRPLHPSGSRSMEGFFLARSLD